MQVGTGARRWSVRAATVAGAAALAVAAVGGVGQAAGSAGDPAAGAAYLVGQLAGSDHLSSTYGGQTSPDYGGTADLAIALASTGTQDATLAHVLAYLEAHTADYADPAGTAPSYPGPYSGAVGKLAVVAEITGQDPRSFGGFDLLSTLTSHVCTAATQDGDCTAAGDFSQAYSPVSQALDVLALARGGVEPPPAAVTRLEQLQCADGGFSSTLIAPGAACTSDVDTTGFAVQALVLVPSASASVTAAEKYLVAQQEPDGGFTGAAGENVNSTALAVQALFAGDPADATAAQAGQAYLAKSQHASGGLGVHQADTTDDERATAQAVPALAGTTLTTLAHAVTPVAATTPTPAPSTTPTTTAPAVTSPTTVASAAVTATPAARTVTATGTLPYTGEDSGTPVRLGIALLLGGCALTAAAAALRRQAAHR